MLTVAGIFNREALAIERGSGFVASMLPRCPTGSSAGAGGHDTCLRWQGIHRLRRRPLSLSPFISTSTKRVF